MANPFDVSPIVDSLPNWYSERYNEDGDTIWLPLLHRTWTFERGRDPYMLEGLAERTRGRAQAIATGEWGEPFTHARVRKVWMRQQAGEDPEFGWCEDMAWECKQDDEGALPYWRVDYAPPKRPA